MVTQFREVTSLPSAEWGIISQGAGNCPDQQRDSGMIPIRDYEPSKATRVCRPGFALRQSIQFDTIEP